MTFCWKVGPGTEDGVPYPADHHSYKFISQTRWAWVMKDGNGPSELATVADTLLAFRTRGELWDLPAGPIRILW